MSYFLQPHGLWSIRHLYPSGFSRQEYWGGLPCSPLGHLPNPGIEPRSPALQVDSIPSEPPEKPISLWSINFQKLRPLNRAKNNLFFLSNDTWINRFPLAKKKKTLESHLTLYTDINTDINMKWINNINISAKILRVLEESTWVKLHVSRFGNIIQL